MNLLLIALAPVIIILFYVYFRDKYEKEPIGLLLKGLLFGALIVIPIIFVEELLSKASDSPFYTAFVVAAFTEELFKYLVLILAFYSSRHFNERFDGIVYAVFISLGFALVENILYVIGNSSMQVGIMRAFTAVPAHAIFGVIMGFHLGLAKFGDKNKTFQIALALIMPIFLHGIYDWLLLSESELGLTLFFPFIIIMWIFAFNRMKRHSNNSFFRGMNNVSGPPKPPQGI